MKIFHVTDVTGLYFDWNMIDADILQAACDRGTGVHAACGSWALFGITMGLKDEWRGYLESFKKWHAQNVVKTVLCEKRFTDKTLGFTGRIDFVFDIITNERVLVDIKTPAAESKPWKAQLAAYDHLLIKEGKIKVDDIMSLRLPADGGPAKGRRYGADRLRYFAYFQAGLTALRGLT